MQSLKNLIPALFILIIPALPGSIFAVSFYGEAETLFDFMFPGDTGSDRYDSLLNPHNISGLNDIATAAGVIVKLENQGEKGSFAMWLSLRTEPDSISSDEVKTDIMRLSYDWQLTDAIRITTGRQSFLTGYGYGWNPMDLANPIKDPSNPDQELKGVDAVSFTWDRGGIFQARGYTLLQTSEAGSLAYEEAKAGAELTFLLPPAELKITALTGSAPDTGRIESLPRSIGIGFLMDIAGAGVYAEGAFRERRRTGVPGASGDYALKADDDPAFSALAGIEYYFRSELALIAEYFYNGEGLGRGERSDYKDALEYFNSTSTGYAPEEYYELYRPGYFARHYLLLNLTLPLYDLESEASLTVIESPDSRMISATPRWKILPSGSFEIEISYSGLFSLDDGQYNEAWLSPVKHSASIVTKWYF
ncbi:MAG: hypothetical protein H7A26_06355 [Spirochaetales bacterium]|nr:hypothetical protein [Spirochaetales bacterium]